MTNTVVQIPGCASGTDQAHPAKTLQLDGIPPLRMPYAGVSGAVPAAGAEGVADAAGNFSMQPALEAYRMPAGATAQTFPRYQATTGVAPASGTPAGILIPLPAGLLVSNLTFTVDTPAELGGTHGWYAITDNALNVLAVSADQAGAAVWSPVNTAVTLPVLGAGGAPFITPYRGFYRAFVCVVATTMPAFACAPATRIGANANAPVLAATSGTGATAPPAVGSQMTALTANGAFNFYAYTS